jgi:tetratricopeptide (TPR) repeat protein
MYAEDDQMTEATAAWKRADERGNAEAANNLGISLRDGGGLGGAEAARRRADERGYAGAANSLGRLLKDRGDFDDAESAFQRAQEARSRRGGHNLAMVRHLRRHSPPRDG